MIEVLFSIIILIFSVVIHEVSHGLMADRLGDPTARLAGRLTLNPINHLDWFGSIILPLLTYNLGGFIIGWAKPVPYNPYNLKGRFSEAWVAIAGPISNLVLAVIFGLVVRFAPVWGLPGSLVQISAAITLINVMLAIFNLVPIPPLDGSKILFSLIPYRFSEVRVWLEKYSLVLVMVFVFFIWQLIIPVVGLIFRLITGL
ncbi:MAG: site-2 protease family protein [Candidatus Paceibacterota bacterium]|jgi:Zn-dependent protease